MESKIYFLVSVLMQPDTEAYSQKRSIGRFAVSTDPNNLRQRMFDYLDNDNLKDDIEKILRHKGFDFVDVVDIQRIQGIAIDEGGDA